EVYAATRAIPAGSTATYGEIARAIGRTNPEAAREVGAALARNPTPIIVPCHRVVGANGKLTGFSAPGGLATKRRMLQLEGAPGYGQECLLGYAGPAGLAGSRGPGLSLISTQRATSSSVASAASRFERAQATSSSSTPAPSSQPR